MRGVHGRNNTGRLGVNFEQCKSRGFDEAAIATRLSLVGLGEPESRAQSDVLQGQVIRPNAGPIVESFYDSLVGIEEFNEIVGK